MKPKQTKPTEKQTILNQIKSTKECIDKYDAHNDRGKYNMRFLTIWLSILEEKLANLK